MGSGDGRVCTTFAIELKMGGEADPELVEKGFLLGSGFGNAAQPDFAAVSGGKYDIGALQSRKQGQGPHRRQRLRVVDPARR